MNKTNAMRMLDAAKIHYETLEYEVDENDLSGLHIAQQTGYPAEMMFKTLVLNGDKNGICVVCIPVGDEVDLKKAAVVSGNKKLEMVHVKDLLKLTGYIRGGCSPVGMKKKYPTYISEKAKLFEHITISAGVRGCQLVLKSEDIISYTDAKCCDITK